MVMAFALLLPTAPTLEVQHVEIESGRIAYAELGNADAPALLLLNGTASPMSDWDPKFLRRLVIKGHRVIVFDYPGLGASSRITEGATFADLADDAVDLVDALGYESVNVLGWSMGGFIAQEMLTRHPGVVRRAVLAATNPGGDRAKLGPKWVQKIDSNVSSGLAAYVKTNYPKGKRHRGWAFINRVERAIETGRYPKAHVPEQTELIMVAAEDPWLRSNQNYRKLKNVTTPVLIIDGRKDRVTPIRNSQILAKTMPNASLKLIPDSGHSFLFQRPRSVADVVDNFLNG